MSPESERRPVAPLAPRRLREYFDQLIELEPAARATALDAFELSDAERARLIQMLAADEHREQPFFRLPAADWARRMEPGPDEESALIGQTIGPFRVTSCLGHGGSAVVYRAERSLGGAVQAVALKLMYRDMHSPEARRRFQNEQRILTQLSHPNIAHLVDAGISDSGTPYIAMEFVDGQSLLDYATTQSLSNEARLRLMMQLCSAVDAAHRALVVHRDLKPTNVLVTREGQIKVLDFGIGKLMDGVDPITRTQHISLTPGYAAPEQYRPGAVTVAVDVYALGVILGELLVGVRFEPDLRWPTQDKGLSEARQRWDGLDRDLRMLLRTAVAEDPALRYPSAARLAEDLKRLLANEPITLAGLPRWYPARKFVARHRVAIATASVMLVALVAALGFALQQASVAREQTRVAKDEATRAAATSDFMVDLLETASATLPKQERPTPQQLIEQAAKKARDDTSMAEPVRAQILATLGRVALSDAEYAHAESLLAEALDRAHRAGIATDTEQWLYANVEYADLLRRTNRSREAERLLEAVLPALRERNVDAAVSGLALLAATHADRSDVEGALAFGQLALTKAEGVSGLDTIDYMQTLTFVGELAQHLHRQREAETQLDAAVATWRRLALPRDEHFARVLAHLGVAKEQVGHIDQAEALLDESIALSRQIYDKPHDRLAALLAQKGVFLARQDRFDEADALLTEALAIDRQVVGEQSAYTASVYDARALLEHARGNDIAAQAASSAAVQRYDATASGGTLLRDRALARLRLIEILLAQGKLADADAQMALLSPTLEHDLGAANPDIARALALNAERLRQHDETGEALRLVDQALDAVRLSTLPCTDVVVAAQRTRALAWLALGHPDEADAAAKTALSTLIAQRPDAAVQRLRLLALQARIASARGDRVAARQASTQAAALHVPSAYVGAIDAEALRVR